MLPAEAMRQFSWHSDCNYNHRIFLAPIIAMIAFFSGLACSRLNLCYSCWLREMTRSPEAGHITRIRVSDETICLRFHINRVPQGCRQYQPQALQWVFNTSKKTAWFSLTLLKTR